MSNTELKLDVTFEQVKPLSVDFGAVTEVPTSNETTLIDRSITSISNDKVTEVGTHAFSGCFTLAEVNLPNATSIGMYAFQNALKLEIIKLPSATELGPYVFTGCTSLTLVDILGGIFKSSVFYGCGKLKTLIIRSNAMAELQSISAFSSTPFDVRDSGGTLYVPQSLIATYSANTNWKKIIDRPNNQILSIEGSIYEED